MSEPTDRPPNRLHSAARVLPAVTVDCSSWPRSEGARSRGTLTSAARRLPPAVGRWLEIRVQFTADTDLRVVEALTVKLIRAAAAAAPELGLTYDPSRSRPDGGDVIVAVTPTNPTGAEGRLADIVRAIEGVLVERGAGVSESADVQWCTVARPDHERAMADEVELPTAEDIRRLPRWARVAFAARCARRALPLFREAWSNAPEEHVRAVEHAVSVAEQTAGAAARTGATHAAHAAEAAGAAARTAGATHAAHAAEAAGAAAHAAEAAGAAARTAGATHAAAEAAGVAHTAARAAEAAQRRTAPSIAKDFQSVLRRAQVECWTDETPVPPEVFGPLDEPVADPPPAPPPLEQDPEAKFALRAIAEPGVPAEVAARHVVAAFQALNEYTLARYGTRITKDQFRRLVYSHTEARV